MIDITVVSFTIILILFVLILESVRRRVLEVRYSILWIITCVILSVLSLSRPILERIAHIFGIVYAPSLLFLFGMFFCLLLIFDFSRIISKLNDRIVNLTQEHTLLKNKLIQELKDEVKKVNE